MSITDSRQLLERLARSGDGQKIEQSTIAGVGGGSVVWPVRVKSHISYNVYMVRAVVIGEAGTEPVEIGEQVEAVNLGESFMDEGTVAAGTCAAMHRVGERNVFYAVP